MFKIRTMNAISHLGTDILAKQGCEVGQELERPDALLIRSADLHGSSGRSSSASAGPGPGRTTSRSSAARSLG